MLDGSYQCPEGTDKGTIDLFWEIAHIRRSVPENSVNTTITQDRWADHWRSKKEKTSSSKSGLHFGHYKASAMSEIIARHDALKTTICNKWGFALDRWCRGLSCMLEKTPGCNLIEKLRSILLMEADYNANYKELFGNRMMAVVREHGLMMEEIFSKMGRTAEDGALSKILFYDIV